MDPDTILVLPFLVAKAVAIAVQRLAVPYTNTVALIFTGLLSQPVQEKLLADIDTQLLRLESAEAGGAVKCPFGKLEEKP